jgi:hypothetical protein
MYLLTFDETIDLSRYVRVEFNQISFDWVGDVEVVERGHLKKCTQNDLRVTDEQWDIMNLHNYSCPEYRDV